MSELFRPQPGPRSAARRALYRIKKASSPQSWAVDANDGIIATAGLLEGFAGAGAGGAILITAGTAATLAGSLSIGGARWAEAESGRDVQAVIIAEESAQLASNPDGELAELKTYWENKGLSPEVAAQVAGQLSARDALAAQLEFEHGITEPIPPWLPAWSALTTSLAYISGALAPLLLTFFAPGAVEAWAIALVVVVSFVLISIIAARSSHIPVGRTILRSLVVGLGTLTVSYLVGLLLL
jgi:VIT1/CCC1 family predicted Fe2+/Mn2+ transporter